MPRVPCPLCSYPLQAQEVVTVKLQLETASFPCSVLNQEPPLVLDPAILKRAPRVRMCCQGTTPAREEALGQGLSDTPGLQRLLVCVMCSGLVKHNRKVLCPSPLREGGLAEA